MRLLYTARIACAKATIRQVMKPWAVMVTRTFSSGATHSSKRLLTSASWTSHQRLALVDRKSECARHSRRGNRPGERR